MKKQRRVTIKDLAEEAGLAISTISMALNDHPKVKKATRDRIQKLARERNYVPNISARALSKSRTNLIGVLIPSVMDSFYPEIIQGIEDVLFETEIDSIVCHTRDDPEKEKTYFSRLMDKQLDGFIYEPPLENRLDEEITRLQRNQSPVVAILRVQLGFDIPYVIVDNVKGAKMATTHLLELGHKNIGFLAPPSHLRVAKTRLEGYKEALAEWGVPFNPDWVEESNFNWEAGMRSMRRLLSRTDKLTAVFATSDIMAVGASYAIKSMGLHIPGDFSLVGFDGLNFSAISEVPITTISQPRYEIGKKAAQKLLAMLKGEPVTSENIEPKLIVRASSCPPRNK